MNHILRICNKIRSLVSRPKPEAENRQPDPWYIRTYWAIYRFFKYNNWSTPRGIYNEVRYFWQRGTRGWSDRDIWSLDDYLSSWLPAALTKLKETKHGFPCSVIEPEDCDGGEFNITEEGFKRAQARWDAIMDKMVAGFEADRKVQEGLFEEELGVYPLGCPAGVSSEAWLKMKEDRRVAEQELEKKYEAIWQEGIAAFVTHYRSLWD